MPKVCESAFNHWPNPTRTCKKHGNRRGVCLWATSSGRLFWLRWLTRFTFQNQQNRHTIRFLNNAYIHVLVQCTMLSRSFSSTGSRHQDAKALKGKGAKNIKYAEKITKTAHRRPHYGDVTKN